MGHSIDTSKLNVSKTAGDVSLSMGHSIDTSKLNVSKTAGDVSLSTGHSIGTSKLNVSEYVMKHLLYVGSKLFNTIFVSIQNG